MNPWVGKLKFWRGDLQRNISGARTCLVPAQHIHDVYTHQMRGVHKGCKNQSIRTQMGSPCIATGGLIFNQDEARRLTNI